LRRKLHRGKPKPKKTETRQRAKLLTALRRLERKKMEQNKNEDMKETYKTNKKKPELKFSTLAKQ
jgi:hypothetical protein